MDFARITTFIPLIAATGYTALLIGLLWRSNRREQQLRYFTGFLAMLTSWQLLLYFLANDLPTLNIYAYILLVGTLLLGMTTSFYIDWPGRRRWLLLGSNLVVLTFLLDVLLPRPVLTLPGVALLRPTVGGLAAAFLGLVLGLTLFLRTWLNYRVTRFPWHANRLLHWAIFLLLTFIGEPLLFLSDPLLFLTGQFVCFVGVFGLARAVSSYRLFDIQARIRHLLAFAVVALTALLPAGVVLWLAVQLVTLSGLNPANLSGLLLMLLAGSFLLYQPYRRVIDRATQRLLLGREFQTGTVVRSYSQAISRTLDVEQLSLVIVGTLSELLEINRGALLLVSEVAEGFEIEPVPAMGQIEQQVRCFPAGSPLMNFLSDRRQVLLQYDIDFNPNYAAITREERTWLAGLAMELYVPVHTGTTLTGLIALGPKSSGLAYRPNELELVQVLADQTVIALQNARLYSELNTQNDRIRLLNTDLRQQNARLEILDKVKTDFITIASHELRTPLTQVKGYADILAAMNEEQGLTREQIREIVGHINRASLRLEKLISAMLDASQLEVSGMQLTFVQTRLETVIQLAVDPIASAIRDRHLKLVLRGLDDVPPIEADFKRLVQAFNNLISNAVKYTPDYGMITVSAELAPSRIDDAEYIEVVVADTGIGINPEYQELIFEKFFRIGDPELHSTGSTKFKGAGPGLGLHIVKGVIEEHGGQVWVESYGEDEELLPGSRFHVIIPVTQPALKDTREALEAAASAPAGVGARRPEWLIG